MWRDEGGIFSRRDLLAPNATQTHSQPARRLNKEKPALTLWNNEKSFGLRFLHRLRPFCFALFPSSRRFYSHPLPPSSLLPLPNTLPAPPQTLPPTNPPPLTSDLSHPVSTFPSPIASIKLAPAIPCLSKERFATSQTFCLPTIRSACLHFRFVKTQRPNHTTIILNPISIL